MILRIQVEDTVHNIDVGDLTKVNDDGDTIDFTMDERSQALDVAMAEAGLDINSPYVILGEA